MSAITPPGERDLTTLLSTLTTTLHPLTYAFLTLPHTTPIPTTLNPLMTFHEPEGLTLIITLLSAQSHNLPYSFPCRMITLNVQSSLSAVGFLAVITRELGKVGVPVNAVSGFYHDHLFVPVGREEEAVRVLEEVAREARVG